MAPRRFETTLFELVAGLSDTLRDDGQTLRVVAQLVRDGRVRTPDGLELKLGSDSRGQPPAGILQK